MMKEIPTNRGDVKKILLDQLALIKQESERTPEKLPELTEAMCKIVAELRQV